MACQVLASLVRCLHRRITDRGESFDSASGQSIVQPDSTHLMVTQKGEFAH